MRGPRAGRERGILIPRIALLAIAAAACTADAPPVDADEGAPPAASVADTVDARPAPGEPGDGVAIAGRVVGGEAGAPVPGAYVVVLGPDVTLDEWEASSGPESEALMEAATVTGEDGAYRLPGIARGRAYTLIVAAEGYEPAVFDHGLEIRDEDPAVVRPETVRLDRRPR